MFIYRFTYRFILYKTICTISSLVIQLFNLFSYIHLSRFFLSSSLSPYLFVFVFFTSILPLNQIFRTRCLASSLSLCITNVHLLSHPPQLFPLGYPQATLPCAYPLCECVCVRVCV